MFQRRTLVGAFALLLPGGLLAAAEPKEEVQILCDSADPKSKCPGADCVCVEDSIEITLDGDAGSVLEYEGAAAGTDVTVTVVMDAKSDKIQGWSYGVRHDMGALEILSATTAGTDVDRYRGAFVSVSAEKMQTCGSDPACAFGGRTWGGGWISAVAIFDGPPYHLAPGRNAIAKAQYRLLREVGYGGTRIEFTDRLARSDSPAAPLNVTIDGQSRTWTTAIPGRVKRKEPSAPAFLRGDVGLTRPAGVGAPERLPADGIRGVADVVRILRVFAGAGAGIDCADAADADDSGKVDLQDAIFMLQYLFRGGASPPDPYLAPGEDPTPDDLGCATYP